jgi:protoporphyrin/coproporphyrin ferrochelatase
MKKTAVILFNLGGPDDLKSVKPFLFNLFNDPAIISLPNPFRWFLAELISFRRSGKAKAIYEKMGGKSPILELTQTQARALEEELKSKAPEGEEYKVFVSMRYWHPMSDTVVKNVRNYAPDHVIMLPLYPQFSTTTTGSSFKDWERAAAAIKLDVPSTKICCYPVDFGFIASHARLIKDAYWKASEHGKPRILFSAHGLPEKVIAGGDPYQYQVEKTVASLVQILAIETLDYQVCYQSRVGPLKWIGPATEEEIVRGANDKVPLLIVPIAFVSEHSETLVELDIEYRELAEHHGVPGYVRVPALGVEPLFIEALADLCVGVDKQEKLCSFSKQHYCPHNFQQCPYTKQPVTESV